MGMKVSIYLASLFQFFFDELGQNKMIEFDKTENTLAFTIDIWTRHSGPKIICIDELDKIQRQFQDKLLNFMGSGLRRRMGGYDFPSGLDVCDPMDEDIDWIIIISIMSQTRL